VIAVELSPFLTDIFGRFHYLAPFLVLLFCGLGLPLPEEVSLIGAGILLSRGEVEFLPMVLVCSTAILLGDSAPYWLGRHWGARALRVRTIRRLLHPERIARLEQRFREHGNWATFVCRFLPGVRLPGYFVSGTMGMSYPRFLALDALGVAISVPVSIWLGMLFAGSIDELHRANRNTHLILAFVAVTLALVMIVRVRTRRDQERAAAAEREGASRDPGDRAP
jgi:membrane protein DedA with SNARE-associated domain